MKKFIQNKKVIYILAIVVILIGIFVTCMWKTNVSIESVNHTRIDVYIGKDHNIDDIKQIVEEVFGKQPIAYQKIETFNDSVAIHIKDVNDEQIESLKTKVAEKYELEDTSSLITTNDLGSLRIRDIAKPYIIPMIITTLLILGYVGIRYSNLGIFKTVFTLLIRLILTEGVVFSIIQIARIPVGVYTVLLVLGIYILTTMITVKEYESMMQIKKELEKKQKEKKN